jgi:hypothetical protein
MFFYIKIKEESEVSTPCLPKQQFNRFILLYWGVINIDVDRNNIFVGRRQCLESVRWGGATQKKTLNFYYLDYLRPTPDLWGLVKTLRFVEHVKMVWC